MNETANPQIVTLYTAIYHLPAKIISNEKNIFLSIKKISIYFQFVHTHTQMQHKLPTKNIKNMCNIFFNSPFSFISLFILLLLFSLALNLGVILFFFSIFGTAAVFAFRFVMLGGGGYGVRDGGICNDGG